MDRVAVFVDAGYLFAQGSVALGGQKLPRGRPEVGDDLPKAAPSHSTLTRSSGGGRFVQNEPPFPTPMDHRVAD